MPGLERAVPLHTGDCTSPGPPHQHSLPSVESMGRALLQDQHGPSEQAGYGKTAHPINSTLYHALLWVLSNTPSKSDGDWVELHDSR